MTTFPQFSDDGTRARFIDYTLLVVPGVRIPTPPHRAVGFVHRLLFDKTSPILLPDMLTSFLMWYSARTGVYCSFRLCGPTLLPKEKPL